MTNSIKTFTLLAFASASFAFCDRSVADIPDFDDGHVSNCWCNQVHAGTVVKHKEFNGTPLYWEAKWWTSHDEVPGEFVDSGGTSPWALINSKAYTKDTVYQWTGYNSGVDKFKIYKPVGTHDIKVEKDGNWGDQIDKKTPGAYLPTWKDGAEAAYSIILKDLAPYNYEQYLESALEVGREFSHLKFAVTVTPSVMTEKGWGELQGVVAEGHELLNAGYDKAGFAPLWKWFYQNDTLLSGDDRIPLEVQNLRVDSTIGDYKPLVVQVPYYTYSGTPMKVDTQYKMVTYQVKNYEFKKDSIMTIDGYKYIGKSTGKIKAEHVGWNDATSSNETMLKLYCHPGWKGAGSFSTQARYARKIINEKVYQQVAEKRVDSCNYFYYPYDVLCNESQDTLIAASYTGALGGYRSGIPTSGDFYFPYNTDFDNFYMMDEKATKVYPDNPHMRLGLQQLVDNLIKSKGYMVRVMGGVSDWMTWQEVESKEGSIPKSLFREHFDMLDQKVKANELFVGTLSEVVRYRMTADAVQSIDLTPVGNKQMILSTNVNTIEEQFQGEISVIVVLDEPMYHVMALYENAKLPLIDQPRQMDDEGYIWSIPINPFIDDVRFGMFSPHVISKDADFHSAYKVHGVQSSTLRLTLPVGEYSVSLCNIAGKVVSTRSVMSNGGIVDATETNHLANGIYFLEVHKGSERVLREKLIIK